MPDAKSQIAVQNKIKSYIPVESNPLAGDDGGSFYPWEYDNFYHKSMIECLTRFLQIQIDIRNAEKSALEQLRKSSEKR
jgi:hypothetical protein